jgi:hypothetical protein
LVTVCELVKLPNGNDPILDLKAGVSILMGDWFAFGIAKIEKPTTEHYERPELVAFDLAPPSTGWDTRHHLSRVVEAKVGSQIASWIVRATEKASDEAWH